MLNKKFYRLLGLVLIVIIGALTYRLVVAPGRVVINSEVNSNSEISVSVKIETGDKILEYPVQTEVNSSLLAVLQKIKDLPIVTKDYGTLGVLITKIGDQENGAGGKFWQYWLNKKYGTLGVSKQLVKSGDLIEWRFLAEQPLNNN